MLSIGDRGELVEYRAKEALQFAINGGWLTVTDGKVEPDMQITRAEMAVMMARISNRIEFHGCFRSPFDDEEESKLYLFDDVDQKHPMFADSKVPPARSYCKRRKTI